MTPPPISVRNLHRKASMLRLSASDARKWAKTRVNGFLKYVVVYGLLAWGTLAGALFSLLKVLGDAGVGFFDVATYAIPIFMLGGILWGVGMWHLTEWRRARTQAADAAAAQQVDPSRRP